MKNRIIKYLPYFIILTGLFILTALPDSTQSQITNENFMDGGSLVILLGIVSYFAIKLKERLSYSKL